MADLDLVLTNFKELERRIDPKKFGKKLKVNVKKASKKIGLLAEAAIKDSINKKQYRPNSKVTQALKGSSKPLVQTGALFKNIRSKVSGWDTVFIGVLRNVSVNKKEGTGKYDLLNAARILHFGATIKVTEKMRKYFFYLSREFGTKPLSHRTRFIVIPKRPFLRAAVTKKMEAKYRSEWGKAVTQTLRGHG